MKKYSLLMLFLVSILHGFSQGTNNAQPVPTDRKLIQTKIDSAKQLYPTAPVKAFDYVESAISLAIKGNYQFELAEAYYTLGGFNYNMAAYTKAIMQANKAIDIYAGIEKWKKIYDCYHLIGDSYFKQQDYAQARLNYESALKFAERGQRKDDMLSTRFKLANILLVEEKYTLAEERFNALKLDAQAANALDLIAEIDFKLGEIYNQRGDAIKANQFFNYSNSNAVQTNNSTLINQTNQKMVDVSNGTTPVDHHALYNSLSSAQTLFQNNRDTSAWMTNTAQFADFYATQGNFVDASVALNGNYALAQQTGDLEMQLTTTKQLYDLYRESNNKKKAAQAYKIYLELSDSVEKIKLDKREVNVQNQLALKNVEKQIDNLQRERELDQQTIVLLEKQKNLDSEELAQQRLLLYVLGGILLIFAIISVVVYRNIKAKKRAHNLLYLKSLRAQMNPHFIFNSLNSVNNFIAKSDERAANKYVSKFAKLMRLVLEHSQVEFISLAQEIEVLKLYLELEHERFKDQFRYEFTVDPSLTLDSQNIPPMLIQPFIENAIWHGLRYRDEGGILIVTFSNKGNYLEIAIKDNGIGRKKSTELKTVNQKKHQSTGMQNVESRTEVIKAVFKAKIDYEIIDLPNGEGTHVLIKLYGNES